MTEAVSISLIQHGLRVSVVGRLLIYHERVSSTMEIARQMARKDEPEGTVVIAGVQEQGRGRLQRHWLTPNGNIALSVILRPRIEILPYLIMMASMAVLRSIKIVTGMDASIKWPNDVLIGEKKVCGILIENEFKTGGSADTVIGIGINVDLQPGVYNDIAATATSLEKEAGRSVSGNDIIRELLIQIDSLYTATVPENVFTDWRDSLVTLGKPVTATWKDGSIEGIAESVDESGALNVRLADGTLQTVIAGDVTLRKTGS